MTFAIYLNASLLQVSMDVHRWQNASGSPVMIDVEIVQELLDCWKNHLEYFDDYLGLYLIHFP